MKKTLLFFIFITNISLSDTLDLSQLSDSEKINLADAINTYLAPYKTCVEILNMKTMNKDGGFSGYGSHYINRANYLINNGYIDVKTTTEKIFRGEYSFPQEKKEYSYSKKAEVFDIVIIEYEIDEFFRKKVPFNFDFICSKDSRTVLDEIKMTRFFPATQYHPPSVFTEYSIKFIDIKEPFKNFFDKFHEEKWGGDMLYNGTPPRSGVRVFINRRDSFYITDQGYIESRLFDRQKKK